MGSVTLLPIHAVRIFDLSAVTSIQVTSAAMQQLARMPPIIDDPLPRFIVASSDLVYGLARMFQSYGRKTRQALHVVRRITEAYSESRDYCGTFQGS